MGSFIDFCDSTHSRPNLHFAVGDPNPGCGFNPGEPDALNAAPLPARPGFRLSYLLPPSSKHSHVATKAGAQWWDLRYVANRSSLCFSTPSRPRKRLFVSTADSARLPTPFGVCTRGLWGTSSNRNFANSHQVTAESWRERYD